MFSTKSLYGVSAITNNYKISYVWLKLDVPITRKLALEARTASCEWGIRDSQIFAKNRRGIRTKWHVKKPRKTFTVWVLLFEHVNNSKHFVRVVNGSYQLTTTLKSVAFNRKGTRNIFLLRFDTITVYRWQRVIYGCLRFLWGLNSSSILKTRKRLSCMWRRYTRTRNCLTNISLFLIIIRTRKRL